MEKAIAALIMFLMVIVSCWISGDFASEPCVEGWKEYATPLYGEGYYEDCQ